MSGGRVLPHNGLDQDVLDTDAFRYHNRDGITGIAWFAIQLGGYT